jgi:hypothetical protein
VRSLYNQAQLNEIKQRISVLRPDSKRLWGKMSPAQMLAHCANTMRMATGELNPPRMFIGRILGPLVKPMAFRDSAGMGKNSPTMPGLKITDERDFDAERQQLLTVIDRFAGAGHKGCTTHPHGFFGRLRPDEWAAWMYKHLDHHLQQFGV